MNLLNLQVFLKETLLFGKLLLRKNYFLGLFLV